MTDNRHIPQEDIALYAMQALGAEEQSHIDAHLENCEQCRAHLAEASGSLALLAMSVEQQQLPKGSRDRFLERIGAAPQSASRVFNMAERVRPAQRSTKARTAALWISWVATAALILVTLGLGGRLRLVNRELARESALLAAQSDASRRAQQVLELFTAPAARHILLTTGTPRPAPFARAAYLASKGALVLDASNLAPVAPNKAYELWIIPANGRPPVPAGLFRPDAAGDAHLVLPKIPAGVEAKAFGVTVENASGSATPTLPIILAGAVPAAGE